MKFKSKELATDSPKDEVVVAVIEAEEEIKPEKSPKKDDKNVALAREEMELIKFHLRRITDSVSAIRQGFGSINHLMGDEDND